jgi:hypothetical protein
MRKRGFWAIAPLGLSLALMGCLQNVALDTKVPRMTKEELKSMLGQPDVVVADVRLNEEWKKSESKIKSAVREDPEKDIKTWADKYSKDKTLVFYCS